MICALTVRQRTRVLVDVSDETRGTAASLECGGGCIRLLVTWEFIINATL